MKKHIVIIGRVQGVGFRYWLYKAAVRSNIKGWVKNKISGEVEALLIGNDKEIDSLGAELWKKYPYIKNEEGRVVLYVNLIGYSKDGPCRKLTSSFFRDKKVILSTAKEFGTKNKTLNNNNRKIKNFFLFFLITITVRSFIKFYFSKCKL